MPTSLGPAEILVILVVALIVLGPNRLPEAGRQVGKALAEVKRWSQGVQDEIKSAIDPEATGSPPPGIPEPAPEPPAPPLYGPPDDIGPAVASNGALPVAGADRPTDPGRGPEPERPSEPAGPTAPGS